VITYRDLLGVLFTIHDPTTPNRQGNDIGTQYRSVIFYHSPEQERDAREVIAELEREHVYDQPIVTDVQPLVPFYPAEGYHQDYFNKNPNQPYCAAVVAPKVSKIRKAYFDRLIDRDAGSGKREARL
jgi:peptide-methionine (S)-S-oxide reductase